MNLLLGRVVVVQLVEWFIYLKTTQNINTTNYFDYAILKILRDASM